MSNFNDNGFWTKITQGFSAAGREVIEKALWLYYAAQRPETPIWAKTVIFGALSYFLMPLDAIPDFLPGGYVDDLGALSMALGTVAVYINEDVKQQATTKLRTWFGN